MRNDDNVKKFLGGNKLPALDHISTQVHQNNKSGENQRKYDKSHICYFCGACVIKMSRHFIKKHNNNPDVRRFVNLKLNSKDRKNAITLLMLKGDFLHNCAVMKEQKGVLLVLRRPDANKPTKPEDYIPCVYCLGFIHKLQAFKHVKNCPLRIPGLSKDTNKILNQGKSLLNKMTKPDDNSSDDWQEIQIQFRDDVVGRYILNDETLCSWGNALTVQLGKVQAKHIRDRLRSVGTFCIKYGHEYGTEDSTIKEILQTKNFYKNFNLAPTAFGKALTTPVKLGANIKSIITILKQNAIFTLDTDKKKDLENLLFMVQTKWTEISAPNQRRLKEQKPHVVEMPITNDVKLFLKFLTDEITKYLKLLNQTQTIDLWTNLSKNVLAFLIVFNRRREGEVSRLELVTYTQKPDYENMETDSFVQTLSQTEKYLCSTYKYMSTKGKRNWRVPILYPQLVDDALDSLVKNRKSCGIKPNNNFFLLILH